MIDASFFGRVGERLSENRLFCDISAFPEMGISMSSIAFRTSSTVPRSETLAHTRSGKSPLSRLTIVTVTYRCDGSGSGSCKKVKVSKRALSCSQCGQTRQLLNWPLKVEVTTDQSLFRAFVHHSSATTSSRLRLESGCSMKGFTATRFKSSCRPPRSTLSTSCASCCWTPRKLSLYFPITVLSKRGSTTASGALLGSVCQSCRSRRMYDTPRTPAMPM
mmetsp:Transcript_33847/g.106940  ORF Transcript_33847/g.106940 Transcript_33847/m.106940 type:complete len:219 (-) Transcript_33847:260-916(-)